MRISGYLNGSKFFKKTTLIPLPFPRGLGTELTASWMLGMCSEAELYSQSHHSTYVPQKFLSNVHHLLKISNSFRHNFSSEICAGSLLSHLQHCAKHRTPNPHHSTETDGSVSRIKQNNAYHTLNAQL